MIELFFVRSITCFIAMIVFGMIGALNMIIIVFNYIYSLELFYINIYDD